MQTKIDMVENGVDIMSTLSKGSGMLKLGFIPVSSDYVLVILREIEFLRTTLV